MQTNLSLLLTLGNFCIIFDNCKIYNFSLNSNSASNYHRYIGFYNCVLAHKGEVIDFNSPNLTIEFKHSVLYAGCTFTVKSSLLSNIIISERYLKTHISWSKIGKLCYLGSKDKEGTLRLNSDNSEYELISIQNEFIDITSNKDKIGQFASKDSKFSINSFETNYNDISLVRNLKRDVYEGFNFQSAKINTIEIDEGVDISFTLNQCEIKECNIRNIKEFVFRKPTETKFQSLNISNCSFDIISFYLSHFDSNYTVIRECSFSDIFISSIIKNDFFFDACNIRSIHFINAIVKSKILFRNLAGKTQYPILHLEDSSLGETEFIGCNLKTFQLVFRNTNILNCFISKPIFHEVNFHLEEKGTDGWNYQKDLLNNQLYKICERQGEEVVRNF